MVATHKRARLPACEQGRPLLPKRQARQTSCQASRRQLISTYLATAGFISGAQPAQSALVRYPATELNNSYVLLRAGESYADADGIGNSNPVNKQSRYAELTTLGKRQILNRIAPALEKSVNLDSAWIWPSINSSSYATAEILTAALALGQSRVVPEYSFLDCRGLGAYDGRPMAEVAPLLRDGDASSQRWKPPRGWDGTPNESVEDVMVRTRQVLSVTETQYSDETVIFVAPDSTVLSVLQAAILGIDLRAHWKYEYRPAEMRLLQVDASTVRDDSPRSLICERPPDCL